MFSVSYHPRDSLVVFLMLQYLPLLYALIFSSTWLATYIKTQQCVIIGMNCIYLMGIKSHQQKYTCKMKSLLGYQINPAYPAKFDCNANQ